MPNYFYIAKNLKGETRSGSLFAKNKEQLAEILRKEGYILTSADTSKKGKKKSFFYFSFRGVSLVERTMFTRNLKVMISAGLSLPRALGVLEEQIKNIKFKKAIADIRKEVISGKSFSESLEKYPHIFSNLFVNMIKVGEEAGTLGEVLDVLTNQMEKDYQLRSKVKGAMMYPAVILSAMVGVGILMMILVVPKLSAVYSDLHIQLPITTRLILGLGNTMAKFWYIIIPGIFAFLFLIWLFIRTKNGKRLLDTLSLKLPIISLIVKKTNAAQTVRTLGSLIASGVPIVRSLKITAKTIPNFYYREALIDASKKVGRGEKLSDSLEGYKEIYPILIIQMVRVGEETGETSSILKKLATFYEEEVSNITQNLSSIIEPVLILIIGGAVGFFAISIIQPIYGMMQGIK